MNNGKMYFQGLRDGQETIITIVNYTIKGFKEGASEEELKFLNELQEELDACAEIVGGRPGIFLEVDDD